MMNVIRTYQTLSLEAKLGGLDVREFTIMANPHENEHGWRETNDLTIMMSADRKDFYTVFYDVNGRHSFLPLAGMDRDLWKTIWRKFRILNRQL